MNKYSTFNKLLLFSALEYLQNAYDEGLTKEAEHIKIMGAIKGFKTFHRFDDEEARLMMELGKEPAMKAITEVHISYVILSLELLRLWVELVPKQYRPSLNISDKRLKTGRSFFVISMLRLKSADKEKHEELKEIIDDSVLTARKFIAYTHRRLVEEVK